MAGTCMDLDECMTFDQNDCMPPTTCSNTPGSYECICPDGNVVDAAGNCGSSQPSCPSQPPCGQGCFDAGGICEDLNECMTFDQHDCLPPTTCSNTNGGYECICPDGNVVDSAGNCGQPSCGPGYYDMDGICMDLNECMTFDQHHCKPGSTCVNNDGGYTCMCPNGDEANPNGVCLGTGYEKLKGHFLDFRI